MDFNRTHSPFDYVLNFQSSISCYSLAAGDFMTVASPPRVQKVVVHWQTRTSFVCIGRSLKNYVFLRNEGDQDDLHLFVCVHSFGRQLTPLITSKFI